MEVPPPWWLLRPWGLREPWWSTSTKAIPPVLIPPEREALNHHRAACTSHTLLWPTDVLKQRDNRNTHSHGLYFKDDLGGRKLLMDPVWGCKRARSSRAQTNWTAAGMTVQTHHSSSVWMKCVEMTLRTVAPLIYAWMSQTNAKISARRDSWGFFFVLWTENTEAWLSLRF